MTRPPTIVARNTMGFTVHNASYSIDKAKERLGWRPDGSLEALEINLSRSTQWQIESDGERRRGMKLMDAPL
jgi:nucleoside-diphosphate-sugar epimerase